MKISTHLMFEKATQQMSTSQTNLAKSQAQLAQGKQIITPSDAPDQASTIQRLKSIMTRQASYQTALNSIQTRLQGEDSTLQSVSDLLIRAKEVAVQASNDTLSPSNRKALGVELQGLRDQILSLANSKDSSGNYIFAGSRVSSPPFVALAGGSPQYMGDQTRMNVMVGENRSMQINRSGTDAFSPVNRSVSAKPQVSQTPSFGNNIFPFTISTPVILSLSVHGEKIAKNIIIPADVNTPEGIVKSVNDAGMGITAQLINTGDNTRPFKIVLTGQPGENKDFNLSGLEQIFPNNPELKPSLEMTQQASNVKYEGVGFFNVMDDLINGVNTSSRNLMQGGVGELDHLLEGLTFAQANIGSGLKSIEQQNSVIEDTLLNLTTTLSSVEDLDYTAAITKMNQQMMSLEAAQSSFAKISQLNLFNFIK